MMSILGLIIGFIAATAAIIGVMAGLIHSLRQELKQEMNSLHEENKEIRGYIFAYINDRKTEKQSC
ncbi:MAG: ABC transporter permease [bacterium]